MISLKAMLKYDVMKIILTGEILFWESKSASALNILYHERTVH